MINKDDLIGYFSEGEKAPGNVKIGTEHENYPHISVLTNEVKAALIKDFD